MTESFSNNAQWIFAGIGASSGGREALADGHELVSTSLPSIMEISLQADQ